MKRYLIMTDVHWSTYSSIIRSLGDKYSTRLHNLIDSVSWAENLSTCLNCDAEICAGDFFDRPDLTAQELTALQEVKWNDNKKYFLVGNHESNINSLEYSSTKALESFNVDVISDIKRIEINDKVDFYFIPYMLPDKITKLSDYLVNNNKKKVVFAHADLAGLQYGKFVSQTGFDIKDIVDNCSLFINGHLHNEMIIENKIVIVGNLTGENFNENAKIYKHQVYVLTVEDDGRLILESYENPYAFNFYKIKINNYDDIDDLKNLKNNAVLSIVCLDSFSDEVRNVVNSLPNVVDYRITLSYAEDISDGEKITFAEDYMKQFIEFVQTKIQPSPALESELALLGGNCNET